MHEMETKTQSEINNGDEEDYIDIEVSSSSTSSSSSSISGFFSFAVNSPPHSREFEFQMCSSLAFSGESTTSPADELFYKGKLLPLHLPPRLQMVQKLLETSAASTPPDPHAVSPCESRRLTSTVFVRSDENLFELSSELKNFIDRENPRSTLNQRIKQFKPSSLTRKLKASRAYITSLFTKTGCSDSEIDPKSKIGGTKYSKSPKKKNPYGKIESFDECCMNSGSNRTNNNIHRKSFSGVIQRHCPTRCLSYSGSNSSGSSSSCSSFSFGSNGCLDLQILNRSSSVSSEIDNSIEGAIAHCKQSFSPRKSNVRSGGEICSSRTFSVYGMGNEKGSKFP